MAFRFFVFCNSFVPGSDVALQEEHMLFHTLALNVRKEKERLSKGICQNVIVLQNQQKCDEPDPSCARYVTLQKYFSHPSVVIYFSATPPRKLKLGQQIGGGLLIANHLHQSS